MLLEVFEKNAGIGSEIKAIFSGLKAGLSGGTKSFAKARKASQAASELKKVDETVALLNQQLGTNLSKKEVISLLKNKPKTSVRTKSKPVVSDPVVVEEPKPHTLMDDIRANKVYKWINDHKLLSTLGLGGAIGGGAYLYSKRQPSDLSYESFEQTTDSPYNQFDIPSSMSTLSSLQNANLL